ncbi:MAG: LCP family protein [candidate division WOR-3 bacterium]
MSPAGCKKRRFWFGILCLGVILIAGGIGIALYLFGSRSLPRHIAALGPKPTGVMNILIIGRDARALNPSQDCGTSRIPREKVSRADIIVICHINFDLSRVTLVAIPRDLLVEVPGSTHATAKTDFHNLEKINAAFAIGGPKLLMATIEKLLGIKLHRFIIFDFDSFRMIFRALRPFIGALEVSGVLLTDPDQALKFARRRNGLPYDDLDRCRNAVGLIKAMAIRAWRFAGTRVGDWLLARVFSIVGPDTDLTQDEVKRLADALLGTRFSPKEIEMAVLVSEGRMVWMNRYGMRLSCNLPHFEEIEKQADYYLRDRLDIRTLSFMTQEAYRWPWYLATDYDSIPRPDTTSASMLPIPAEESEPFRTRLLELRHLYKQQTEPSLAPDID